MSQMRHVRLFAGLSLTLLAAPLPAQVAPIPLGTRIRVETTAKMARFEGALMLRDQDSIVVRRAEGGRTAVATASVKRIRVSEGKSHRTGIGRGAKRGAIAGSTILGVLGGVLLLDGGDFMGGPMVPLLVVVGAGYGAVIGGMVGFVVGAERWNTVYGKGVSVTYRPSANGRHSVGLRIY